VRCPVLLFYGEEDEWTPIEPSLAAWRRAATNATVVRLPGTGHAPRVGGAISPDYTAALVEWVERRVGTG
jgi:pimeloyl-ACP methyl ester carboxylesterase